jgi:hypothetical protein
MMTLLVLAALALFVAPGSAVVAAAGSVPAVPAAVYRAEASSSPPTHATRNGHVHKEGKLAVVASVIGVIAIVVGIVALGSVSARRRTRGGPPAWMRSPRDPRDGGRGLFR